MDTSKLYEGMIVKNYKALCEALGVEEKGGGNSKQSQLKEFTRYFKYERDKQKYIISKLHEKPLPPNINKSWKNADLRLSLPEHCDYIVDTYGYDISELTLYSEKIIKWKCSKCGSHHDKKIKMVHKNNHTRCAPCSSSKGEGVSLILLDELKIKYKKELTFPDLVGLKGSRLRFDFAIYNNKNLVGIIEYDGEWHDTDDTTQEHDIIKNEYCKVNNIPLYRIHHSEKKHLKERVINILLEMDIPVTQKVNCCEKMKEIRNNKNNELLKEIERLQGFISSNNKVIDKYDGIKQTLNN